MAVDLTNKIHGDFSTGSGVWMGYRGDVTGAYITEEGTGVNYAIYSNKLIREYNEKINELNQPKSLYIEPNDAGFRYTNKPLLGTYNGAAGAYSTRTVGFGGPLMRVAQEFVSIDEEAVDVRGDINGNISFNSPVMQTGTRPTWTGTQRVYSHEATVSGKKFNVTYLKDVTFRDIKDYYLDETNSANITYGNGNLVDLFSGQQPDDIGDAYIHIPVSYVASFFGDYLITFRPNIYGTDLGNEAPGLGIGPRTINWVIGIQPVYNTLGEWVYDNPSDDVRCSIWYDQSHTGEAQNNLTQTTAADQPLLCSEGVLKVDSSGTTALDFNGSTQHMVLDTGLSSTINISGLSSYTVFENDATGSAQMVAVLGSFADSNKRWYCPYINVGKFNMNYGAGSAPSTTANTNLNLVSMVADQTQGSYKAFLNNSQVGSNGTLENKGGGTALVGVGGMGDSLHFNGKMGEFIFYSGQSVSTNRESIESNINKHFKIY